jgi:hypothetical protein
VHCRPRGLARCFVRTATNVNPIHFCTATPGKGRLAPTMRRRESAASVARMSEIDPRVRGVRGGQARPRACRRPVHAPREPRRSRWRRPAGITLADATSSPQGFWRSYGAPAVQPPKPRSTATPAPPAGAPVGAGDCGRHGLLHEVRERVPWARSRAVSDGLRPDGPAAPKVTPSRQGLMSQLNQPVHVGVLFG